MLISFVSFKGSPGVTTTVLGLAAAWRTAAVAMDLDPQGGDMLGGLGGGRAAADHTVLDVLADARLGDFSEAVGRHVLRPVRHGPLVLAGLGSPLQAAGLDWPLLA